MRLSIFFNIFLINLLLIKPSLAQEISSSNSKNYEAKTIKKNNEIEIRLIPKNPPAIAPKNPPAKVENLDVEDSETLDESDAIDPDTQNAESEADQEMVYNKSSDGNNLSTQDLADIKAKNSNIARENALKLWREEQKRLREERIESRKEESRKRYQAQKERSVIKEIENLNQKSKNEQSIKNKINLVGSNASVPYQVQVQPSNSVIVPITNSSNASVVNSGSTPSSSNSSSAPVVNSGSTPSSNSSNTPVVNSEVTPATNTVNRPTR
jgi:hypothetical protein